MKKICVFTGTRAEYGLLYWLMKDIEKHPTLVLQTLASGSHFSPEFGSTYKQILDDGFAIDEQVEMLMSSDTSVGTAKSMAIGVLGFSESFRRLKPDYLVILGDRYEALAAAQTAMLMKIPIAHIAGGEVTEGAYDDSIRHAITKMSHLHFTSNEEYRSRVIQLGEEPGRVYNFGSVGLEHLTRTELYTVEELSLSVGFKLEKGKFFLVTYHPVTLDETESPEYTFSNIVKVLNKFPDYKVLITYPNADDGGRRIIPLIEKYVSEKPDKVFSIKSLGQKRYYSALKHCAAVVGNSSSGIAEAPSFAIPTVNIGSRQSGRLMAQSIVNSGSDVESLYRSITKSLSSNFQKLIPETVNPYGDGEASSKIIKVLVDVDVDLVKRFYDI
ncbi:UDP-N-acetylglucosamine 2-epimerase (hydrolyzing) [Vibrio pectenicida]|uniref:UDP-N-acetylglucosamine 2-epimerase (Hydrolyzing) n=1 Tax=Vibrio pectenicida TaxID=62763 RepID=A0A7Y4EDD0_9VIBR|nr:UDP-N-acetylglucosamine 2-epimerase [Vibrio pectenicida]NOH70312.1 UDP-N-acetylglucosamine 2-epimerase (hydrolyzing) [Vibrio pectenicida]